MASFTDKDLGYARMMKTLGDLDKPSVLVGVRGEGVAAYAAANEFGTATIPERSFLRSTVDENQDTYIDALEDAAGVYVDAGETAGKQSLSRLGLRAVSDVQRKIVSLKTPPNAESTIRKKGSSNPLIDTGRLRQSIGFVIVDGDE